MRNIQPPRDSRIATNQTTPEPSPSTDWREIAVLLDCPNAHAVEPVDAFGCTALDCHADQDHYSVTDERGRERILCPDHACDFLDTEVIA
jgi:hypothetical protein